MRPPEPDPLLLRVDVINGWPLTLIHLIIHPPNLNDIHLNSFSVSSDPLEIGPELTLWTTPLIRHSAREYAGTLDF